MAASALRRPQVRLRGTMATPVGTFATPVAVPVPVIGAAGASAPPLPAATSVAAEQLVAALSYSLTRVSDWASQIPGSAIAWRYLKASHQDDPIRTLLEVLLVFFIVRTYLKGRTKGETSGKNFVKLSERVRFRFPSAAVENER
jgi:hypothetical protein